jgi:hypothetical protein
MGNGKIRRRTFLGECTAVAGAAILSPASVFCAVNDDVEQTRKKWLAMRRDPVCGMFSGPPDLDKILTLFPRTTGKPAFDPGLIAENVEKLKTTPAINTGHPFLDLSIKTALAHIDATFQGNHPKYGVGFYGAARHDGFVPTIVAAVDALTAWSMTHRAAQVFHYWLITFVRGNGTIEYRHDRDATSVSEYGQLLHTAALLEERGGTEGWWNEGFKHLDRIAEYLLGLRAAAIKDGGLLAGVPEADKCASPGRFFHNSAWAAKGLLRWADLCERQKASPKTSTPVVRKVAADIGHDTLQAIRRTWPSDPNDWWLPPQVEPLPRPACLTDGGWSTASYTNYRYWPELLSSGLLPAELAHRVVESRLSAGGQFCGMSRFAHLLDDWPLADYLYGLWSLGRKNDFLLSLYGHIAYHQAEGHLTAYEAIALPPGERYADYSLPCQLVAARAGRLLVK